MSAAVEFFVPGVPVPQGSKTGFVVGKRAVLVDANKALLKPWRALVTAAAVDAMSGFQLDGPVRVHLEFRFVRPASVKRAFPAVKPDLDKLQRSIFDGITDSGLWRDDAQVVDVHAVKVYADVAGVAIRIYAIEGEK